MLENLCPWVGKAAVNICFSYEVTLEKELALFLPSVDLGTGNIVSNKSHRLSSQNKLKNYVYMSVCLFIHKFNM